MANRLSNRIILSRNFRYQNRHEDYLIAWKLKTKGKLAAVNSRRQKIAELILQPARVLKVKKTSCAINKYRQII
jgi:hypothetical protein